MENVAAVEELQNEVRRRMADVTFTIDPPASIEWKPGQGFGIASPHGAYGEGVDFIVDDAAAAAESVARVLQPYSAGADLNRSLGADVLQEQLVSALSAHIDRVVGQVVHTTIEKLLRELTVQVGDVSADVKRVEQELSRIATKVFSDH